jgi:hypothetical protein
MERFLLDRVVADELRWIPWVRFGGPSTIVSFPLVAA